MHHQNIHPSNIHSGVTCSQGPAESGINNKVLSENNGNKKLSHVQNAALKGTDKNLTDRRDD